MATHNDYLTAPTTSAVLDANGRFIIYKDNQTQELNITPGTASGSYAGYDTSVAFAFSTNESHVLYPYDTNLIYALEETASDHDVTIYFYTAGRTSLTSSTPAAYSNTCLAITFHIFQNPTSSLTGSSNSDGSIRTDSILTDTPRCYSQRLGSGDNYVRHVKCTTELPATQADSTSQAGYYNWYIYYTEGHGNDVTAASSHLRIQTNSNILNDNNIGNIIGHINVDTAYRIGVRPVCLVDGNEIEGQLYLTATKYCVAPTPTIDITHIQNYADGPYDPNRLKVDTNDSTHPYTNNSLSYIYNTIVVPFTYDTGITLNPSNPNATDDFIVGSNISTLEINHYSKIVTTTTFAQGTPTANGQSTFSIILTINLINPTVWGYGTENTFTFSIKYGSNSPASYQATLRRTYNLTPNIASFTGQSATDSYHLLNATTLSINTENDWNTPSGWCYTPTEDTQYISGKNYYEYANGWILRTSSWSSSSGIYERTITTPSNRLCTVTYSITLNGGTVTWTSNEANSASSWLDTLNGVATPKHVWTAVYNNLYSSLSTFYSDENDIKGSKQGTLTCTITTHLGETFSKSVPFYVTLDEAPVVESATLQMRTTDNQYVDLADHSDIYTGEYIRFYFTCKTYNRQNITIQPQISRAPDNTWRNYGSSQTYTPTTLGVTGAYRGIVNSALYYPNQATPTSLGDITNNSACQFRLVITMAATNKTVIQTINGTYNPQPSYAAIWSNFSGEFNVSQNKGITLNSKLSWLGYDSTKVSQASIDYNYILNPDVAEPTWLPILTSPPDGPSVAVKNALIGNGRVTSNSTFKDNNNPSIIYVQASVKSYLTNGDTLGTFPKINNNAYTPYGDGTRTTYGPIIAVACALNTVAYRRNRIGINVDAFDTNNDSATLVKIQGLQSISQVVFNYLGTGGSEVVSYVDVHDESDPGYAVGNGFLFDGGTYSYNS